MTRSTKYWMRWHEIISEGRDAPLFHGTSAYNAVEIISQNGIAAKTQQLPDGGGRRPFPKEAVSGVSLSRSIQSAAVFAFSGVIFELDQSKLVRAHRLEPMDYWGFTPDRYRTQGRRQGEFAEAEEFVVGPIPRLDRYLIAIHILKPTWERLKKASNADRFAPLLDHPLLRVEESFKPAFGVMAKRADDEPQNGF